MEKLLDEEMMWTEVHGLCRIFSDKIDDEKNEYLEDYLRFSQEWKQEHVYDI